MERTPQQLGKWRKAKGGAGERELKKLIDSYGFTAERTQQFCGKGSDSADVRSNIPGLYIESKRYADDVHNKHTMIHSWLEQAKIDAKGKATPVVFVRSDRQEWFAYLYQNARVWDIVTDSVIVTDTVIVRIRAKDLLDALAKALQCPRCKSVMPERRFICEDCEEELKNGTTSCDSNI